MKFKLAIKLIDCVPSKTVLKIDCDCVEEAIEQAQALYDANAMISSVTVCNPAGEALFMYDRDDTSQWAENLSESDETIL